MTRPPTEGSPPGAAASALACLATLALGFLLGRALSPTSGGDRAATPAQAGAARSLAGVPISFPDSPPRGGAGRRCLPARLRHPGDPAARRAAAPDRSGGDARLRGDDAGGQLSPAPNAWRRGRSARASAPGADALLRRSRSATGSSPTRPIRARVLTWGFTLLGNASSVEPAAYFGLTHTELGLDGRRWKIAETRGGFGPTPKLATTRARSAATA